MPPSESTTLLGPDPPRGVIAVALGVSAAVAAAWVTPNAGDLVGGLASSIPSDIEYSEILPWLGFMSAGAAGLMWYSYWVRARGFGMAGIRDESERPRLDRLSGEDENRLRGWIRHMTLDTTIAIVGVFVITVSFLILGTELLRPEVRSRRAPTLRTSSQRCLREFGGASASGSS